MSEWIQAGIGVGQLVMIGWGLWQMQNASSTRSDQIAQLQKESNLQMAALRKLLEEKD